MGVDQDSDSSRYSVRVSNLSPETTAVDIRELFPSYGEIEILNIKKEDQSATAEVLLQDEETAMKAVKDLDGKRWKDDRILRVGINRRRVPGQPKQQP
ncbi:MAG: RNA-binding protein [Oculatellaceae cyanobacterium Prado106]|jgi:RNA recognition motif-containing protein|nr:RNA-binding protein [Oculatellaceae cyanobacterium Prado106]